MNNGHIATIKTPKGEKFEILITQRKKAQKPGIKHYIGFLPESNNPRRFSFTGIEVASA